MAFDEKRALEFIARSTSPAELQQVMQNAERQGEAQVRDAAFRRLCEVKPAAAPGTLEHAVWQSIYALEGMLTDERGKTTLLSRTRQKIGRDGERKTVRDLVVKGAASAGFQMLIERGMPDLTFEALALKFPDRFEAEVRKAAAARLVGVA